MLELWYRATSNGTTFRTLEDCNFKSSDLSNQVEQTIFETDSGAPTKFLLRKQVKAQSGEITDRVF